MSILNINDLALQLIALDFSDGHAPNANNGGPTKTSRALAIIHLAAHDAYAQITKRLKPKLDKTRLPTPPATLDNSEATGSKALLCAGFRAARVLYPDFKKFIDTQAANLFNSNDGECCNDLVCKYGEQVADAWIAARMNDGSSAPQLDTLYNQAEGRHRPDPLDPNQKALGRTWGLVTPFVLSSVVADAFLEKPPLLNSPEYATAFNEVIKDGKNDLPQKNPVKATKGIFWGYDGSNKIGVPPRIYNQFVRAIDGFAALSQDRQITILTAINVAMADAAIAAWYWKYQYDLWRPVVGIREADAGWGPQGKGDDNAATIVDPFWLPLGAPNSNPINKPANNGTPNFPAYPSGHATFGAACFKTAAALINPTSPNGTPTEMEALLKGINVTFVSDEFNGVTTDNTGTVRPKFKKSFNLFEAIDENNQSRIYLGVHWQFDAIRGEILGTKVANKTIAFFKS
jgi:membrane-associated phospholipid phosphatase